MKNPISILLLLITSFFMHSTLLGETSAAESQLTESQRQALYNQKKQVALKGYDPVAYFKEGPQKGNKALSLEHKGIIYHFASKANQTAFRQNPAQYEPAFGGWCAWAMAENGDKVSINPKAYKIVDGKNYVFYNGTWGNTLKAWNKKAQETGEPQLSKKADSHWQKILKSVE